jgi:putative hydrolase of the HAD superfamily
MLKAVFFDAAGTLFGPREPVGASYVRIAREYGVDASVTDVEARFRRTFHEAPPLAFGPGHSAHDLRRLERQWWYDLVVATFGGLGEFKDFDAYFDALFAFFADPMHWIADANAAPTLERLSNSGRILGVISNFDHRLYRILDGLGLSRYFDSVTISSEAGYAKPAPEVFRVALAQHSVQPVEALHVGDSEHLDLAGAAAAGVAAIVIAPNALQRLSVAERIARISSFDVVIEAAQRLPFP